ncbi:gene transfer agent family protein [uncultured Novosphingobium sp.]|uniref:gene transfer agent family protein n=1 Tax=uncultured Novosphingobium sp. TaxID=292277 RepID=UPI002599859B|nr:gene transfer agent family protein [uncultured Novosphingobium sp.]
MQNHITLEWADGSYNFRLPWAACAAIEQKSDAGIQAIYERVMIGQAYLSDVSEIIRQGLLDRYQRAQLQAIIDLEGANSAAGKRAQIALDAQTEITNGRKASALRSNQSPLEAYRDKLDRDAGETSDLVEGYVVDELQSVRDSIRGSIEKQIGIKDPLISGLLNMLIEDVLIKPMLDSLKNADGSGGGFIGSLVKFGTSLFGGGRAIGGPVKAGVPYMVGENGGPKGRELFVPQQSGVIVPNHRLKGNTGTTAVYQTFTIDNRGGITTPELLDYVNSTARSEATRAGGAAYAQSQQSAPGTINKYNQLRG